MEDRPSLCISTSKARGRSTTELPSGGSILQRYQSHLRQSKHCRRIVELPEAVACIVELSVLIVGNFVAVPLEIVTMKDGNASVDAHAV
jgi:hypothetical protein